MSDEQGVRSATTGHYSGLMPAVTAHTPLLRFSVDLHLPKGLLYLDDGRGGYVSVRCVTVLPLERESDRFVFDQRCVTSQGEDTLAGRRVTPGDLDLVLPEWRAVALAAIRERVETARRQVIASSATRTPIGATPFEIMDSERRARACVRCQMDDSESTSSYSDGLCEGCAAGAA